MIELQHLTKRYGGGDVVNDLTLEVADGESLVLLGRSGSGKTTTLKMINRLVEPTTGSVRVDGQDVARLVPHVLRRRIGYVFQQVGLFSQMTVAENIGITPALLGWTAGAIRRRVDELLELVDLDRDNMGQRQPAELSGGQQQRVGVARALAANPRVMLLDEPFGALDPLTRSRLQDSFIRIRRELRLTAVFVTHDMVEALRLGDRIVVLRAGRLVQVGTPATLMRSPADDYVRRLLETPRREAQLVDALLAQTEQPG